MLSFPFLDLIILLIVIVAVFVVGLILGIVLNQRLRNKKEKVNNVAAEPMAENDPELRRLPRENQKLGREDFPDPRNGQQYGQQYEQQYKHHSKSGYNNRY